MPEIEILLPANWAEIIRSGKFPEVMKILNTPFASDGQSRFAMFQLLSALNGLELGKMLGAGNRKQRRKVAEEITLESLEEIVSKIFPALDFIYGNEKFYINPFPTFIHEGVTYAAGTSGRLSDQTGEEWAISHQEQFEYSHDSDIKHIRLLVAANYHRVLDGKRCGFNSSQMMDDAEALKNLKDEFLTGIALWYNHADSWWSENFPWIFNSESEQAPVNEPDGKEIRSLLFELSGNKIDSAWDTVRKRSRQDIIFALDELEKKRAAAEARQEAE